MSVPNRDLIGQLNLPPGFRFFPTDEELIVQYLCRKVAGHEFSLRIIGDVDLYKFDPWVLPGKAVFGEKEWYFFSPRDRKYPNGSRPNRVAGCGYWKATGTDKVIMSKGRNVGVKKALVFYMGKAPQGTKTNWIMHEFRLFDSPRSSCTSKLDDWVLCRIYKKNSGGAAKSAAMESSNEYSVDGSSTSSETSHVIEDQETSLPDDDQKLVLENYGSVSLDWSVLAGLTAGPEFGANGPSQAHGEQQSGHVINDGSATCVPSLSHIDGLAGGFANQRPNTNNMMWAQNYLNSVDPFVGTYMATNPVAAFGFRE